MKRLRTIDVAGAILPAFSRIAPLRAGPRGAETMRPLATTIPDFVMSQSDQVGVITPTAVDACPICQGAGWLRMDVPVGHPSFGRLLKCSCQVELEAREKSRAMRQLSQLSGLEAKSL